MPKSTIEFCDVLLTPIQEEKVDTIIGHILARMLDEEANDAGVNINLLRDLKEVQKLLRPGVRLAVNYLMPQR